MVVRGVVWRGEALVADQPLLPGLSARIVSEITGGPEGNVWCYWVVDEGRLAASAEGRSRVPTSP